MENKLFKFIIALFISMLFLGVVIYADSTGVWHNPNDVQIGIFGKDEVNYGSTTDYYVFDNPVRFNGFVQVNDDVAVTGELKVNTIRPNTNGNVVIILG